MILKLFILFSIKYAFCTHAVLKSLASASAAVNQTYYVFDVTIQARRHRTENWVKVHISHTLMYGSFCTGY